jgi:hypothetical protein
LVSKDVFVKDFSFDLLKLGLVLLKEKLVEVLFKFVQLVESEVDVFPNSKGVSIDCFGNSEGFCIRITLASLFYVMQDSSMTELL